MKNTLVALFVCMLAFCSKAQISFVKGYIVNEKGDTIRGEVKINPKKEQDNYSKVFFKEDNGAQKNYKPNKIKAYGYDNQNYIAMNYEGEINFYKVLAKGEIALYKAMFEVINMNASSYTSEYFLSREEDNKLITIKESKFKKQLQDLMSGAAGYANDYADDKKLNEESAVEVINKYNARNNK